MMDKIYLTSAMLVSRLCSETLWKMRSSSGLLLSLPPFRSKKRAGKVGINLECELDEENTDWLPQANYHKAHCEALDKPNLASDNNREIEEIAQPPARIAPPEWLSSTTGPRLLSEIYWFMNLHRSILFMHKALLTSVIWTYSTYESDLGIMHLFNNYLDGSG